MPIEINAYQRRILKAIAENPGVTKREIEGLTKLSETIVQAEVKRLSKTRRDGSKPIHCEYFAEGRKSYYWYLEGEPTGTEIVEAVFRSVDRPIDFSYISKHCIATGSQICRILDKMVLDGKAFIAENDGAGPAYSYVSETLSAAVRYTGIPREKLIPVMGEFRNLEELKELSFLFQDIDSYHKAAG